MTETPRLVEGTITEPVVDLPIGTTISITTKRLKHDGNNFSGTINNDFDGAILSVISRDEENEHIWGTAYLIALGIALTARHVVEEYEKSHMMAGLILGSTCYGEVRCWQIDGVHLPIHGDTAILLITPRFNFYNGIKFAIFRMTARAPLVGEKVTVIGFKSASVSFPREEGETRYVYSSHVSAGNVEAVDDDRPLSLRFKDEAPNIQVGLETFGSMSGGPALDKEGYVVGTISTGMNFSDPPGSVTWIDIPWETYFLKLNPIFLKTMWPNDMQLITSHVEQAHRISFSEEGNLLYNFSDDHMI